MLKTLILQNKGFSYVPGFGNVILSLISAIALLNVLWSSSDTDQFSVCGWFGIFHSEVLHGDFFGRLAVTQNGQQADKQQPAEHPGALHGPGGGGGGGRRSQEASR